MRAQLTDMSLAPSAADVPGSDPAQGAELLVRITADGRIEFEGGRAEVEAFLEQCARLGIVLDLAYLSWCG